MHGVEVVDVYGAEQLELAAEHLLSQMGVDREHGVVDMRVVALDVTLDGEEYLLHLVVCGFHAVGVALVGIVQKCEMMLMLETAFMPYQALRETIVSNRREGRAS